MSASVFLTEGVRRLVWVYTCSLIYGGCRMQRILLVDDDPAICDLVSSVLEMDGYDVVSANDGASALDLAKGDGGIGLVLSDVVMPGINGVQLREKLRTLRPELRCILM